MQPSLPLRHCHSTGGARCSSSDLRGALVTLRTTHRAAITTTAETGALLRAVEDYEGNDLTRIALRLLPHLFVRPNQGQLARFAPACATRAYQTQSRFLFAFLCSLYAIGAKFTAKLNGQST